MINLTTQQLLCVKATVILLLASVALLSGCATLNQAECVNADWDVLGYKDGASGRSGEFLGLHQRACARHNVEPNEEKYSEGYTRGLYDFCVPPQGYQLGLRAETYHFLCPSDVGRDFLTAYIRGLEERRYILVSRYRQLDFYDWSVRPHRHEHQEPESGHSSHRSHRHHRRSSYLDDLKYERLRVDGLINHSRRHLTDFEAAG